MYDVSKSSSIVWMAKLVLPDPHGASITVIFSIKFILSLNSCSAAISTFQILSFAPTVPVLCHSNTAEKLDLISFSNFLPSPPAYESHVAQIHHIQGRADSVYKVHGSRSQPLEPPIQNKKNRHTPVLLHVEQVYTDLYFDILEDCRSAKQNLTNNAVYLTHQTI